MNNSLIISHVTLRRAIGILGFTFPAIIGVGAYFLNQDVIQPSISAYYYTNFTGDVFVGILFMIGLALFSYKGHEKSDDLAGDFACLCIICVALFPTPPENQHDHFNALTGYIHYGAATLFFLTLIYFCLCLFVKSGEKATPQKRKRNSIYKGCGYFMLICIVIIALNAVLLRLYTGYEPPIESLVYWMETFAVMAFGIAWFVKGETILRDSS